MNSPEVDEDEQGRLAVQRLMKSLEPLSQKREAGYVIEAGSDLDSDHQRMPELLVGHSVERGQHHAMDCLWGLDQLLVATGPQHFAPFLLIRGAIETSAQSVWLLQNDNQTERLQRRVGLELNDAKESANAISTRGIDDQGTVKERESGLVPILKSAGLIKSKCKFNGYTDVVREADDQPKSTGSVELAWRACSAMSHGKLWAFQMFGTESNRVEKGQHITATYSPSYRSIAIVLDVAVRTVNRVDELFDKRRMAPV